MEHLLVYGTLRPGGSNHDLLLGETTRQVTATADGLALYANASETFPYATTEPGRRLVGTLCWICDTHWPEVCRRLDLLEGYQPQRPQMSHYHRRRWPVETLHGRGATAWIYLASPQIQLDRQRLISSGNWLQRPSRNPT